MYLDQLKCECFLKTIEKCYQIFYEHSSIDATKGKNDAIKAKKISFFLGKIDSVIKNSGGFDLKLNKALERLQLDYRKESLPLDTFNNRLAKLKLRILVSVLSTMY
ncbi:hypothetical protein M3Y97_00925200 [Aphelenchoides bicaudatus]|nr:hypothetical protein M3Y97_00925200 [Aphelenchoides bicaudatus]